VTAAPRHRRRKEPALLASEIVWLRRLLKRRSGVVLDPDKSYLAEMRLATLAQAEGFESMAALLDSLRTEEEWGLLHRKVIDAMMITETSFFRDVHTFHALRTSILPELIERRTEERTLHVWCAACASGQEPYSIAMLIREQAAALAGIQFDILATDISTEMIARAIDGTYSQFEVQRGLPIRMLIKYFKQIGDRWRLDDSIRKMVEFRQFNLLDGYRSLGAFDIVFCRNVLIYFDQPTKTAVLDRIGGVLANQGVLFLGGAESVLGISAAFKPYPGLRGAYALARLAGASATAQRATA
jgi:chemotaxis protein methyltransferase CheR